MRRLRGKYLDLQIDSLRSKPLLSDEDKASLKRLLSEKVAGV